MQRMEAALAHSDWLVGNRFSVADIGMAPYVNRLAALALTGIWEDGRLPRVAQWFAQLSRRTTYISALVDWVPADLVAEMHLNGERSWQQVKAILNIP